MIPTLIVTDADSGEELDRVTLNSDGVLGYGTGLARQVFESLVLQGLTPPEAFMARSGWSNGYMAVRRPSLAEQVPAVTAAATDPYHGQFCRNPLHPGPCKGWKKAQGGASAPAKAAPAKKATKASPAPPPPAPPAKKAVKKAAPAAPAPVRGTGPKFPKRTAPRDLVTPNSKIGKPSTTGKADIPISKTTMQIDWEKHNAKLTKKQKEAVNLYSTGAHHYINRYMRTPEGETPEAAPQTGNLKGVNMATLAATLQDSMAPAPRGTKVFRGMGFRSAGLSANPTESEIRALAGKVMKNDGFTSTSVSRDQAFEGFERGIEMQLEVPKGTPSLWLNGNSDLPWEQELLLASGAKIEVISVSKKPGTSGTGTVWQMKARVVP